jgi:hypothetical protein
MRTSPMVALDENGTESNQWMLFGRMHSHQITGTIDDIPRVVLERVERDHPEILENTMGWIPRS